MTDSIKSIQEKAVPVLKQADVVRSSIFGSYVRGEATEASDIDLLVEFKGKKDLFDLVDLKDALERALQREVDVLTYQSISPRLKAIIDREQIQIL